MMTADDARALMPKLEIDMKLIDVIILQIETKITIEASKGASMISNVFDVFILLNRPTIRFILNRFTSSGFICVFDADLGNECNPSYSIIWDRT